MRLKHTFVLLTLLLFSVSVRADSWAIYLYLCGSDLESEGAAATADLQEISNSTPGKEISILVQTGGASKWQNSEVDAAKTQRFLFKDGDIKIISEEARQNMGDPTTLQKFLTFAEQNVPADHKILILWDHGSGSTMGVCQDENYGGDPLSLAEITQALHKVYGQQNYVKKPLDIIGFDACLMATLDVALAVDKYADYMVASQAVEPENGWNYTDFLNAIVKNPAISAKELGKVIVDTFIQGCKVHDTEDSSTLALFDLSKTEQLAKSYDFFGFDIINKIDDSDTFLATMGRAANRAENYYNAKSTGYSDMMDLGSFADKLAAYTPDGSEAVKDALNEFVIYQKSGRDYSPSGISVYYPYDGNQKYRQMVENERNHSTLLILYGLMLESIGEAQGQQLLTDIFARLEAYANSSDNTTSTAADNQTQASANEMTQPTPPVSTAGTEESSWHTHQAANVTSGNGLVPAETTLHAVSAIGHLTSPDINSLEDHPVYIDKQGNATMELGATKAQYVDDVAFYLFYYDEKADILMKLGKDSNMQVDWENGIFKDNFTGTWPCIDGHLVTLEYLRADENFIYYNIPIMYNKKRAVLDVIYDLQSEQYLARGARIILSNDTPNRRIEKLKAGDEIGTIFEAQRLSSDEDEGSEVEVDTFTLGEHVKIEDDYLGDCNLVMLFEMTDVKNNSVSSQAVKIEIKNNRLYYQADDTES